MLPSQKVNKNLARINLHRKDMIVWAYKSCGVYITILIYRIKITSYYYY